MIHLLSLKFVAAGVGMVAWMTFVGVMQSVVGEEGATFAGHAIIVAGTPSALILIVWNHTNKQITELRSDMREDFKEVHRRIDDI